MRFEEVLIALRAGNRARRLSWTDGMWLQIEGTHLVRRTMLPGLRRTKKSSWHFLDADVLHDDWELAHGRTPLNDDGVGLARDYKQVVTFRLSVNDLVHLRALASEKGVTTSQRLSGLIRATKLDEKLAFVPYAHEKAACE